MRVHIVSALSSISAFLADLKEFKLHTVHFGTSEHIKPLKPIGQAAEIKFESKFEPLPFIWQSLAKAIPEDNRRFWLQNQWQSSWGRAPAQPGAGRSVPDGRDQTKGVSESATVADGRDWLAWGKRDSVREWDIGPRYWAANDLVRLRFKKGSKTCF